MIVIEKAGRVVVEVEVDMTSCYFTLIQIWIFLRLLNSILFFPLQLQLGTLLFSSAISSLNSVRNPLDKQLNQY